MPSDTCNRTGAGDIIKCQRNLPIADIEVDVLKWKERRRERVKRMRRRGKSRVSETQRGRESCKTHGEKKRKK